MTDAWSQHQRTVIRLPPIGLVVAGWLFLATSQSPAESGDAGWLRYAERTGAPRQYDAIALPAVTIVLGETVVLRSADAELHRGVRAMLGRNLRSVSGWPDEGALVLGTFQSIRSASAEIGVPPAVATDGFWLKSVAIRGRRCLVVAGPNDRGVLYGVFALLRRLALGQSLTRLDVRESPAAPIRFLNHWDNLDGSIERGYAGRSIFWESNHVVPNLDRVRDYARLLASVGINGCSLNNVNADSRVASAAYLPEVARVADALRPWGVRALISLDFAGPRKEGGIETFDPLDPRSVRYWQETVDRVYAAIPDLAGFVLKADSEGRLGPSTYGRTHADAANVIARAVRPHGGLLFYRGFVYDHKLDWRNRMLDRAKAAYDNFQKLDGTFDDNVVIQIKHGPIDFQVREPASPLFGALTQTSQAIELQITQEYLGQQRHVCYLAPMWKETLDFDLRARGRGTPVKAIVTGRAFRSPTGGFVGVSNVGRDTNWLGHHLAMANLYGFGRLAWDPDAGSRAIVDEWTRLTFGHDRLVVDTIVDLQLRSWPAYESYTGNLGIGTLTDINHIHYGPAPESSEHNGWGQWHRSDERGTGMDRTVATGTGFIGQYAPPVARRFESLRDCPDELLLFMHHVPYSHVLRSGKTIIQHFYDAHYDGAAEVDRWVGRWKGLQGRVDERRYEEIRAQLEYQAGHAIVWRDAITGWFFKKSGIADRAGRVGRAPRRVEAESMKLESYEVTPIVPFEAASGEKAIQVARPADRGIARLRYDGPPGWFDLAVLYYDEDDGAAEFAIYLQNRRIDAWIADRHLPTPTRFPDGHSATRRIVHGVALRPGDELRIEGRPKDGERAVLDYLELWPSAE